MSTDHHDPHAFGAPLTAAEINAPLGELDAAISAISGATYNVLDYGAVGDGVANDTAAIQAAVDACATAGGGSVLLPNGTFKCNVTLKTGVTLRGSGDVIGYASGGLGATTLRQAAAGYVVDTPISGADIAGIVALNIIGGGASVAGGGIRIRSGSERVTIKSVSIHSCADEGVLLESGTVACVIEDVLTTQVVLNRSRAAVIGAVDVNGSDHWLHRIEAGISGSIEGTVQSANLYCVALAVRMSAGWITDCGGEISDVGIYVSGGLNRFSSSRGDLNYGHGWLISGSGNQFSNCLALNNSQDTTNTYDNWNATSTSGNNQLVGCLAASNSAKVARYGFFDGVQSESVKNHYIDPFSTGHGTAAYKFDFAGASVLLPSGPTKTLTANSTTPSVTGYGVFTTANTNPTTITDFTGGVGGQSIEILCNDANTTIQHNGTTILLFGAGNKKLRSGAIYRFVRTAYNYWREVATFPLGVTADVGDAAKTLTARLTEETVIWNTPLGADRAVTLSTTGAYAGASFRIVRTAAATGAFNLNVGTGPLKALVAGTWCDVTHNGTAWVLTGYGAL